MYKKIEVMPISIVVTEEMLKAGESELEELYGVVSSAELVRSVYTAMARKDRLDRPRSPLSARLKS